MRHGWQRPGAFNPNPPAACVTAGDVETALAFVARLKGARALQESEWVFTLSLHLGWMAPREARAFVARALAAGVLAPDGNRCRLVPDPGALEAARGFRPDPAAQAGATPAPAETDFLHWVDRLAREVRCDRSEALARIGALQERMGGLLTAQAAVLWLVREAGVDVRPAARALLPVPTRPAREAHP